MILITGGTGLVGAHLILECLIKNLKIRAIYRSQEKLNEIELFFEKYASKKDKNHFQRIEWIKTNLNDIIGLDNAFNGIDQVYHCAAKVSLANFHKEKLFKTNIEGTANIVNLCIKHKVKKLAYVSSIAAIGAEKNIKIINESNSWFKNQRHTHYAYSKFAAELEVWRGIQEGLDVVIVNPGVIIGYDFNSKSSSSIFKRVNRESPFYTSGRIALVDINDVVKAMVLLMNSNIKNERFILVSENITQKKFLDKIAIKMNKKKPRIKLTRGILIFILIIEKVLNIFRLKRTFFSYALIDTLFSLQDYDGQKIKKKINLNYTSVEKSLETYFNNFQKTK